MLRPTRLREAEVRIMVTRWGRMAAAVSIVGLVLVATGSPPASAVGGCGGFPGSGSLSLTQVQSGGTNVVDCGLVGRVIYSGSAGLTIPGAGEVVGVDRMLVGGGVAEFRVSVSPDGVLSYTSGEADTTTKAAPGACQDDAYSAADRKEYGTYNWYMGDGTMPGGMSRADAQAAYADAINNVTGSNNDCGVGDLVGAQASYKGYTTKETDMNADGHCTDRDHTSTWDAGTLPDGTLAQGCYYASWSIPGVKNDLAEADVRYNTTEYAWVNTIGEFCYRQWDIRGVGTHEAGHIFGLNDLSSAHSNLTMYGVTDPCEKKKRTLGYGDMKGLWSIY
jgi:hypothetical protein